MKGLGVGVGADVLITGTCAARSPPCGRRSRSRRCHASLAGEVCKQRPRQSSSPPAMFMPPDPTHRPGCRARHAVRGLRSRQLLRLWLRLSGSVQLQEPRRVSLLQRPPHGRDRRPSRRSRLAAASRAPMGALRSEAPPALPAPQPQGRRRCVATNALEPARFLGSSNSSFAHTCLPSELEDAYAAMARDEVRESEALEWTETLAGDGFG